MKTNRKNASPFENDLFHIFELIIIHKFNLKNKKLVLKQS